MSCCNYITKIFQHASLHMLQDLKIGDTISVDDMLLVVTAITIPYDIHNIPVLRAEYKYGIIDFNANVEKTAVGITVTTNVNPNWGIVGHSRFKKPVNTLIY